jgi:hypothetical protein
MAQLLSVSLDLTKIDKSKIVEGKNGGKYLNLTISVNDQDDQYGNNISVWGSQSKEEREAKANRVFIGNGKKLWEDNTANKVATTTKAKVSKVEEEFIDLPF